MRKQKILYRFLAMVMLLFGCSPNGQHNVIPLTDESLINPSFSSAIYAPSMVADEFCLAKTTTGVSIFYSYSTYLDAGIYEIPFSGIALTFDSKIDSSVYGIPSIDAVYDDFYNVTRLSFFYNYPNWTDPDEVTGGSYVNGTMNKYGIDGTRTLKTRIALVDETTHTYLILCLNEDYLFYKLVSFTGPNTQVVSPPNNFPFSNTNILYHNGFLTEFRDVSIRYNHNISKILVGVNFVSASQNYFQMIDASGPVGSSKVINKYDVNYAPEFAIAPAGNYFLIAYSSNLNIEEQNLGNSVLTGEHVRLGLINSNGINEPLEVGTHNPDYCLSEKSISLPLPLAANTSVGKICMATSSDSEVGLSFVRDGNLYFTRVIVTGNKLSISPISTIDSGFDVYYASQLQMYWDGVYYITYYDPYALTGDVFRTYVAN